MADRILIVEDNKALAKVISKKLKSELDVEIDIAYQLSEAKLFLKMYKYFLTLLDLNLPDAPNGEVVDYALSKGNKVIVLSGNINKEFRKNMLNKNIIDYINKGGVNDINYIISTINRLQKNRDHTVLVVDDSMVFRKQMLNMLENLFFNVVTVAHGEEALGILSVKPEINLVITDYNMPVMNGLELLMEIRKDKSKADICVIVLSSNNDDEINALFLKQGANDYISKPFSKEEFSCRINNSIEALENIQIVTNHANRDFLTGLYNKRYFYSHMNKYFEETQESGEQFVIAMIDIDHFKKINDTYGHDVGDQTIIHLSRILSSGTNYRDLVSKFGGEEFCIVLKNINRFSGLDILEKLRDSIEKSVFTSTNGDEISFTISIGAVLHEDDSLEDSISQADMMLHNAKDNGRNQVVFQN